MSKFQDRLLAELLFREKPKEKKMKSDLSFKEFVKMQKDLEDYQEWRKSKEKKEDKPKTMWAQMSIWQKLTVLMITVPVALMAETLLLLKFGLMIANVVH